MATVEHEADDEHQHRAAVAASVDAPSGLDESMADAPFPAQPSRRDVLGRRIVAQYEELLTRERDVREGEPEGVHRMRVATRRLRSCFKTFAPGFESSKSMPLETELAWLGDAIGGLRDAEVLRARLWRSLDEHLPAEARPAARAALEFRLDADLAAAHAVLEAALSSARYTALLGRLAGVAESPPYAKQRPPKRKVLERCFEREVRSVRRGIRAGRREAGERREERLHQARRAAKRARYAAETLEPMEGKRARRAARRFEAIQDALGERHDAVIARNVLRELAHGPARAGELTAESRFYLGALAGWESSRLAESDRGLRSLSRLAH